MKSIDEIRSLAEKQFPYNPYDEALFSGFRTAKIEGFIKGFQKSQYTLDDLMRAFDAGRNLSGFTSFDDFMNTLN
jgi:hypothetical protein